MTFEGAVIREQGVTFAIVIVQRRVLDIPSRATEMIASLRHTFDGMPVVLMAQDSRGVPTYYGRQDIARFLANVSISQIPWRRYTLS